MILLEHPQGSKEWLQARAGAITASRFCDARAKLQRKSKNGNIGDPSGDSVDYAWTIAQERIAKRPLDQTFVTWQMRRGTELEPVARMTYEERTGYIVTESGLLLTDDGKFGYSTDGQVDQEGLIEIKIPANCSKIGEAWSNPELAAEEYIDQIEGGLWLTGRAWCDLIIFCPWLESVGKDLFIKRIYRNDDRINALEADLISFERSVSLKEYILRKAV